MKHFKRTISLVLVLAMMLGMSVTVRAATQITGGGYGTNPDSYITGTSAWTGDVEVAGKDFPAQIYDNNSATYTPNGGQTTTTNSDDDFLPRYINQFTANSGKVVIHYGEQGQATTGYDAGTKSNPYNSQQNFNTLDGAVAHIEDSTCTYEKTVTDTSNNKTVYTHVVHPRVYAIELAAGEHELTKGANELGVKLSGDAKLTLNRGYNKVTYVELADNAELTVKTGVVVVKGMGENTKLTVEGEGGWLFVFGTFGEISFNANSSMLYFGASEFNNNDTNYSVKTQADATAKTLNMSNGDLHLYRNATVTGVGTGNGRIYVYEKAQLTVDANDLSVSVAGCSENAGLTVTGGSVGARNKFASVTATGGEVVINRNGNDETFVENLTVNGGDATVGSLVRVLNTVLTSGKLTAVGDERYGQAIVYSPSYTVHPDCGDPQTFYGTFTHTGGTFIRSNEAVYPADFTLNASDNVTIQGEFGTITAVANGTLNILAGTTADNLTVGARTGNPGNFQYSGASTVNIGAADQTAAIDITSTAIYGGTVNAAGAKNYQTTLVDKGTHYEEQQLVPNGTYEKTGGTLNKINEYVVVGDSQSSGGSETINETGNRTKVVGAGENDNKTYTGTNNVYVLSGTFGTINVAGTDNKVYVGYTLDGDDIVPVATATTVNGGIIAGGNAEVIIGYDTVVAGTTPTVTVTDTDNKVIEINGTAEVTLKKNATVSKSAQGGSGELYAVYNASTATVGFTMEDGAITMTGTENTTCEMTGVYNTTDATTEIKGGSITINNVGSKTDAAHADIGVNNSGTLTLGAKGVTAGESMPTITLQTGGIGVELNNSKMTTVYDVNLTVNSEKSLYGIRAVGGSNLLIEAGEQSANVPTRRLPTKTVTVNVGTGTNNTATALYIADGSKWSIQGAYRTAEFNGAVAAEINSDENLENVATLLTGGRFIGTVKFGGDNQSLTSLTGLIPATRYFIDGTEDTDCTVTEEVWAIQYAMETAAPVLSAPRWTAATETAPGKYTMMRNIDLSEEGVGHGHLDMTEAANKQVEVKYTRTLDLDGYTITGAENVTPVDVKPVSANVLLTVVNKGTKTSKDATGKTEGAIKATGTAEAIELSNHSVDDVTYTASLTVNATTGDITITGGNGKLGVGEGDGGAGTDVTVNNTADATVTINGITTSGAVAITNDNEPAVGAAANTGKIVIGKVDGEFTGAKVTGASVSVVNWSSAENAIQTGELVSTAGGVTVKNNTAVAGGNATKQSIVIDATEDTIPAIKAAGDALGVVNVINNAADALKIKGIKATGKVDVKNTAAGSITVDKYEKDPGSPKQYYPAINSEGDVSISNDAAGTVTIKGVKTTGDDSTVLVSNTGAGTLTVSKYMAKAEKTTPETAPAEFGKAIEAAGLVTIENKLKGDIVTDEIKGVGVTVKNDIGLTADDVTTNKDFGTITIVSIDAGTGNVAITNGTEAVYGRCLIAIGTTDEETKVFSGGVVTGADVTITNYSKGFNEEAAIKTGAVTATGNVEFTNKAEGKVETGAVTATGNVKFTNEAEGKVETGAVTATGTEKTVTIDNWADGSITTGVIKTTPTADGDGGDVTINNRGSGKVQTGKIDAQHKGSTGTDGTVRIVNGGYWAAAVPTLVPTELAAGQTLKGQIFVNGDILGNMADFRNYSDGDNVPHDVNITFANCAVVINGSVATTDAAGVKIDNLSKNGLVAVVNDVNATDGALAITNGADGSSSLVVIGHEISAASVTVDNYSAGRHFKFNDEVDFSEESEKTIAVLLGDEVTAATGDVVINNRATGLVKVYNNVEATTGDVVINNGLTRDAAVEKAVKTIILPAATDKQVEYVTAMLEDVEPSIRSGSYDPNTMSFDVNVDGLTPTDKEAIRTAVLDHYKTDTITTIQQVWPELLKTVDASIAAVAAEAGEVDILGTVTAPAGSVTIFSTSKDGVLIGTVDNDGNFISADVTAKTSAKIENTGKGDIQMRQLKVTDSSSAVSMIANRGEGKIIIDKGVDFAGAGDLEIIEDAGAVEITNATGHGVKFTSSGKLTINGATDDGATINGTSGDGVHFDAASGKLEITAGTINGTGVYDTNKTAYGLNVVNASDAADAITLYGTKTVGDKEVTTSATYNSVYTANVNGLYKHLLDGTHDWAKTVKTNSSTTTEILARTVANFKDGANKKQALEEAGNTSYSVVKVAPQLVVSPTSASVAKDKSTTPTLSLKLDNSSKTYTVPAVTAEKTGTGDAELDITYDEAGKVTIKKTTDNATHAEVTFTSEYDGVTETFEVKAYTTSTPVVSTGGGGGGSAPTVKASISGDDNSVSLSVTTSNGTATVAEPKAADLEKVIGAGVDTGEVVIDLSKLNSSVDAATIPTKTFDAIEAAVTDANNDADELTIKLPASSVTFNAAALDAIADQATGSTISLEVSKEAVNKLASAQQNAVKDLEVQDVYSVTLTSGNKTISDFKGGSATVSVNYTLKAGQSARGIVVWYVAKDGTLTEVPATFANGKVTFTVSHFSDYVIAYDAERAAACPQDSTCPIAAFSDADAKAWYHDGVHWALENGVMSGMGDGTFAPNGTTTRAMVAQILWNLEGKPAYVGMSEYADVDNEDWFGPAVRWASAEGIVTGYANPDDAGMIFKPNDAVTREQLATMLYRYAQYKNIDVSVGEDTNILSYEDAMGVSTWAMAAMQWACGAGVVNGVAANGTMYLQPQNNASRAVVATMIARFCTEVAK